MALSTAFLLPVALLPRWMDSFVILEVRKFYHCPVLQLTMGSSCPYFLLPRTGSDFNFTFVVHFNSLYYNISVVAYMDRGLGGQVLYLFFTVTRFTHK